MVVCANLEELKRQSAFRVIPNLNTPSPLNLYNQVKVLSRSRAQPRIIQRSVDVVQNRPNKLMNGVLFTKSKYLKKSKVLNYKIFLINLSLIYNIQRHWGYQLTITHNLTSIQVH